MKKLVTLLLAAGMTLGCFTGAQAVDWKIKGAWYVEFGAYDGLSLMRDTARGSGKTQYGAGGKNPAGGASGDSFNAGQRTDIWVEAVASENLSGALRFEMGHYQWGRGDLTGRSANGAIGQRGVSVGVRNAYLDWFVPGTNLKVRMGIQFLATPSYTFNANVLGNDMAGISASYKINDNVSVTAFWARPFNDNYSSDDFGAPRSLDNIDLFALFVPLSFDGFKLTPWGMIGAIGPNAFRGSYNNARARSLMDGMFPGHWQTNHRRNVMDSMTDPTYSRGYGASKQYATVWWAGLTGEITALDPFRFAWDAVYGSVTHPDAGHLNRQGLYINALAEYKFDWGVPGLYGWWSTGDDGNPKNGSERMPVFDPWVPPNNLSSFGFNGATLPAASPNGIFGTNAFAGTWGIGARIRDLSFIDDLTHTLRANFFGGTNSPRMAKNILGKRQVGDRGGLVDDFNSLGGMYLTTMDYGLELNLDSTFQIYENLKMVVELGYIHLWLDQSRSVWGADSRGWTGRTRGVNVTDAIKAAVYFHYSF